MSAAGTSAGEQSGSLRASRATGFSLLELVVVIVIMSVVSAIAAPRLSGTVARLRLELHARQLRSLFLLADELALSQRRPVSWRLGTDWRRAYVIFASEDDEARPEPRYVVTLAAGLRIEAVFIDDRASPRGNVTLDVRPLAADRAVRLELVDNAGNEIAVVRDAGSGFTRLSRSSGGRRP